jgi:predicted component of type VI protein secretion system
LIKSVDGKTDRKTINEFVDNEFLSVDSRAFRSFVSETSPNLDFKVEVKNSRGEKEKVAVPMTAQFFWPDTGV